MPDIARQSVIGTMGDEGEDCSSVFDVPIHRSEVCRYDWGRGPSRIREMGAVRGEAMRPLRVLVKLYE
jgi:hypothetical protein